MTSSKPNYRPKTPPPNTITLGVKVSTDKFGGDTDTQSIIDRHSQKLHSLKIVYLELGLCSFINRNKLHEVVQNPMLPSTFALLPLQFIIINLLRIHKNQLVGDHKEEW